VGLAIQIGWRCVLPLKPLPVLKEEFMRRWPWLFASLLTVALLLAAACGDDRSA